METSRASVRRVLVAGMIVALTLVASVGVGVPAHAADELQSRVSGQGVTIGQPDPNTVVSRDGKQTWQPAYVVGVSGSHPFDSWFPQAGVSWDANWINCQPSFTACLDESVWYRTFIVLPDRPDLSLSFRVVADNAATPYINGVQAGPRFEAYGNVNVDPALLHPGVNTFDMYFEDWGGLTGFRWELFGTLDATVNPDANHDGTPDEPTNTPPTVAVTGVSDAATYELGDVPAPGCAADDAEDGASSPVPSVSDLTGPLAAFGVGTETVTCDITDAGGLAASASATYTIVDTGAPTLAGAPTTAPNDAGWYAGPVTIRWQAADDGVGIDAAAVPADTVLSADGTGQTASATVADRAGNQASATSTPPVNIDATAPVVAFAGATSYTVDQTVAITCTATDGLSGIATTTCADVTGAAADFAPATTRTASATDVAGNATSASTTFTVTATPDALCRLATRYRGGALGNSLCAKLRAAAASDGRGQVTARDNQLASFRREVAAQRGKALTAAEADTLLRWSSRLF